jgi:hypothetical protein
MKKSARMAAPSCLLIKASDKLADFGMAPWTPAPLKKVGSESNAMAAKMIRAARLRSSFFPARENRNRPRPTMVPIIGK